VSGTGVLVAGADVVADSLGQMAILADQIMDVPLRGAPEGDVLFAPPADLPGGLASGRLPPWSVLWLVRPPRS